MKNNYLIFLCFLCFYACGQNKNVSINGDWININIQKCILKNSLEKNQLDSLFPMYISIKNTNQIAYFYQVEPSSLEYLTLHKKNEFTYYTNNNILNFNDSILTLEIKNRNIKFIKKKGDFNDMFDTTKQLTKEVINYSKINYIINLKNNDTLKIKCVNNGNFINCQSSSHFKFNYQITSSYPIYNKKKNSFQKLDYYMKIDNIDELSSNVYLIEKYNDNTILLRNVNQDYKGDYLLIN